MNHFRCVLALMAFFFIALNLMGQPNLKEKKTIVYQDENIEIREGKTQVIIPLHFSEHPATSLFKLKNGDLILYTSPAAFKMTTAISMRSKDGGQTWQQAISKIQNNYDGHYWGNSFTSLSEPACQLPDGEIIQFGGWFGKETSDEGVYLFPFFRWNNDATKGIHEEAVMRLPTFLIRGPWPNHSIVIAGDGSLLASVQGRFPFDNTTRTFIVRSTDQGRTWNFLSNVAIDKESKFIKGNGYCEPDLLILPTGRILCFMRTSGSIPGTPIYLSSSDDDGQTWTEPTPITKFGVYPGSCLMQNGVIALCYGRPGDWMTFSLDNGMTWIGNVEIKHNKPENTQIEKETEAPDAGHYNSIQEVEPGKLLLVYARSYMRDKKQSEIIGTFIYVRRIK